MQVNVLIKPGSKHREEVIKNDDSSLTVYTKKPAVEGKANDALVRMLAKHFDVSKSQVEIIRGHTSKYKVIRISE